MEGRVGTTAGVTATAETREVNTTNQNVVVVPPAAAAAAPPAAVSVPVMSPASAPLVSPLAGSASPMGAEGPVKKKRGRPRKYAPDGSVVMPLNPTPISSSMPAGEYAAASAAAAAVAAAALKRSRGRPGPFSKQHPLQHQQQPQRIEFDSPGEMVACSAGANFAPHILTVAAGEDVTMKIISFSQQGPRAICILSANGVISNVTLRQPDSSGGTLTYEGRFELLSLSGSFMPSESGGTRSRSGGMSVSLAGPDGRVVGGGVAGLLVAASPVQVVVGSFLPSYQLEQKTKKPRYMSTSISMPAAAIPLPSTERNESYGGNGQGPQTSTPKPSLVTSSSFRGDNWSASLHAAPDTRKSSTDINISSPGG
ncbi:putative AT-hook motif nuclear-localized protein 1 [Iris pallida]|uniref:AT-hook motif nuclear-localized protein n=1 Tax=Iris pallida TaxID=29817 RepID=A0AAX6EDP7_IRIPA|nr:putative AT-hook motif nuclear-localized protein 1 [Iris pallida]